MGSDRKEEIKDRAGKHLSATIETDLPSSTGRKDAEAFYHDLLNFWLSTTVSYTKGSEKANLQTSMDDVGLLVTALKKAKEGDFGNRAEEKSIEKTLRKGAVALKKLSTAIIRVRDVWKVRAEAMGGRFKEAMADAPEVIAQQPPETWPPDRADEAMQEIGRRVSEQGDPIAEQLANYDKMIRTVNRLAQSYEANVGSLFGRQR